ncbi:protein kinase [Desmophyllum pertusum]|uniref:Protein kinase n=1 Tax=Desmophyllum pertusum TaxID=174260 RepID=A0A9W9Y9N9_9CNID|nr:protein kinase [Desmophyllum pertusum]
MASRRFQDVVTDSSPQSTTTNSPFTSCQSLSGTDSPIFQSPRSSPDVEIMRSEGTDPTENTPLITHEDHYGGSMSLVFTGNSSNSFEPEVISFWKHIRNVSKKIKPWFFFVLAVTFSVIFAMNDEIPETAKLMCVSHSFPEYFALSGTEDSVVTVVVSGPFIGADENVKPEQNLTIGLVTRNDTTTILSEVLTDIGINNCSSTRCETLMNPITIERRLKLAQKDNISHMMLALTLNTSFPIAISLKYYVEPVTLDIQVTIAFVILIGVYILIILELVHRATAAMLGALAALSFLSHMNKRPSLETIITWVEWETLSLLFGMMILVAVFAKTGFFDYVALKAYKLSRGHVWALITLLCTCTAVISAVLDNVTVILLLTPVTVTLCQVLNLNPTPILIAEVIFSNIGGTATAIGDPPNVILVSNKDLQKEVSFYIGITFADFTKHLIGGIVFCLVVAYGVLRLLYWNVKIVNDDPPIIEELKREAEIWKRSADRLLVVSAEEKTVKLLLMQKAMTLENIVRNMKRTTSRREAFQQSLQELERKYVIRDKVLLMKSSLVITLVIVLFFVHSFVTGLYLGIGWIAMLGAILLILLADVTHIEDLMEQVEWTTLVFFSALFILMKSLNELGLMDYLGNQTSSLIEYLGSDDGNKNGGDNQLAIALIVVVWVSALVSSFIDNIPFTTAMIPVILELNQKNNISLQPLVWALAMGSCLGGNGTLIGASANVVCAGLAEQYGYPITFNNFFKIGFPIMLATTATATAYLLISHA